MRKNIKTGESIPSVTVNDIVWVPTYSDLVGEKLIILLFGSYLKKEWALDMVIEQMVGV